MSPTIACPPDTLSLHRAALRCDYSDFLYSPKIFGELVTCLRIWVAERFLTLEKLEYLPMWTSTKRKINCWTCWISYCSGTQKLWEIKPTEQIIIYTNWSELAPTTWVRMHKVSTKCHAQHRQFDPPWTHVRLIQINLIQSNLSKAF